MFAKLALLLDRSDWAAAWNERALEDWARGDRCYLGDGTTEFYGPYSIDALELGIIVIACPDGLPPLPSRRAEVSCVMARDKREHLMLSRNAVAEGET